MRDCECYGDKVRNDAISRSIEGFGQNIEPPSPEKDRRAKREGARSKASRPASSLENPKNLYNGQGLGDDQRAGSRLSFSSNRSFEDVLFELKSWKDKGLIDEDEYKTHKAEVLTVAGSSFTQSLRSDSATPGPDVNARSLLTLNQRTYQDPRSIADRYKARMDEESETMSTDEHHDMSDDEPGAAPGVKKHRIDFYFQQLRTVCYRKVRGNGNDVSIREIFRHFDSEKHGDVPGIDRDEFVTAVKRLMLGSAQHGMITTDEAIALFNRIDSDGSGSIDYREASDTLSLPGWDNHKVGKKSNVLI